MSLLTSHLKPSYWSLPRSEVPEVYFIGAECGPIKIGMSITPAARIHLMQSASPSKLTLLATTGGGKPQEREYHQRFAEFRLHGEWFEPAEAILAEVQRLNSQAEKLAEGTSVTTGPCFPWEEGH